MRFDESFGFWALATLLLSGCNSGDHLERAVSASSESIAGAISRASESEIWPLSTSRRLDLGVIPQGGAASITMKLVNASDRTVDVESIDSSCSCVKVALARKRIEPLAHSYARVRFDFGGDDFIGDLSVEITGLGSGKRELFRLNANISVVRRDELLGLPKNY